MDQVLVRPRPRGRIPAANVALFLATVATTLWAGFTISPLADGGLSAPGLWEPLRNVIAGGLPFASALVAILFTHEMGHYVLARRHGVDATLPFFIPVPFGAGTLGAVIRIRSALPSRHATLEIGAAGPIAGFLVAVPLLYWGFAHSPVRDVGAAMDGVGTFASPLAVVRAVLAQGPASLSDAFRILGELGSGEAGVIRFGDSLVTWGVQRLAVGPLPPGHEVFVHPVAYAAWIGLLVTTLNLVPLGQLDGGHVTYALLGRRGAAAASRIVSAGLVVAGLAWSWNWLIWWALTRFVVGLRHPPALREEPLSPGHRVLAIASLLMFVATFVPIPVAL
jgi:membrane-associated protease RseP (regulator of RpoE activity)